MVGGDPGGQAQAVPLSQGWNLASVTVRPGGSMAWSSKDFLLFIRTRCSEGESPYCGGVSRPRRGLS